MTEVTPEPEFLTVTVQYGPETRTSIGDGNYVYWDTDDYVWFANGNGQELSLQPVSVFNDPDAHKSYATFEINLNRLPISDVLYAAYPSGRSFRSPYSVTSDGNISFDIPETQSGSFANANICVAKTTVSALAGNIDLYFRNVTAILKFTRGSNPATSLTIKNNAYPISGQFTAEFNPVSNGYGTISNVLPPSESGLTDGQIKITPANNDTYYYVTVGPCTMDTGTSFIWNEGEQTVTLQNSTVLKYNHIYNLGEFKPNGGSTPADEYYFSVSATKKVVLAPGNLWKDPNSREVYGLNEHQYDNVSASSIVMATKRDKFNWEEELKVNPTPRTWVIDNTTWYALDDDEWSYLFNRFDGGRIGFGQIQVGTEFINGLFILPDEFNDPELNSYGDTDQHFRPLGNEGWTYNYVAINNDNLYTRNIYNANNTDWATMESLGVVFLPATGYGEAEWQNNPPVVTPIHITDGGFYWTQSDPGASQRFGHFYFGQVSSFFYHSEIDWMNIRPARDYVSKGNKETTKE